MPRESREGEEYHNIKVELLQELDPLFKWISQLVRCQSWLLQHNAECVIGGVSSS
jgi:hypothetical protein